MIRPLGVEYDSSAGPGSNCLQLLQKVLVSLLVKATTEQDRESKCVGVCVCVCVCGCVGVGGCVGVCACAQFLTLCENKI